MAVNTVHDIMIKKNLDLKVRIPEWTQPGDVSCRVNGDRQHVEFLGRYVVLDGVRTGDTIEIINHVYKENDIESHSY